MSNFPFTKRGIPEKIYPQDANAKSITPGVNSAFSAFSSGQIVASTSAEFLCCGIAVAWGGFSSSSNLYTSFDAQVQIGVGASGSEVVKAWKSFPFSILYSTGTGAQVTFGSGLTLKVAPFIVPASSRIAVRMATSDRKFTPAPAFYVIGYEPGTTGFPLERPVPNLLSYRKGMTNIQSKVYPTVASVDSGAIQLNVDSTAFTWTRVDAGSFITDGFVAGQNVVGSGFANAQNNKVFTIASLTATVLTMTNGTGSGTGMVTETGSGDEHAVQTKYVKDVTSGTPAWTLGSWAEVIASANSDMLITGLTSSWGHDDSSTGLVSTSAVVEIGIGGAGSEEVVARVPFPGQSLTPAFLGNQDLINPVYVKKGERVALRNKTGTATKVQFCMLNVDEFA